MRRLLPLLILVSLLLVTGCGSDSNGSGSSSSDTSSTAEAIPGGADAGDVAVIDGWATALKAGDLDKAASYWAVPSLASNGTPLVELKTEADVVGFNKALPCGADLVKATADEKGLITATFELTDRTGPGAGCGPGVGGEAATIFKIEDGKISTWTRAPDPGGQDTAPPAPGSSI